MSESWLVLETSGRVGRVGLARDGQVVRTATLDESRRHARDLAATIGAILQLECLAPKELHGVMVGIGPGSYTGLRVGIVSAKVLAYAVGCRLVAVPTFRAIVERVPAPVEVVEVIADAMKGHVFVQKFDRRSGGWKAADELRIDPVETWLRGVQAGTAITGPGVAVFDSLIPTSVTRVPGDLGEPTIASVLIAGTRLTPLGRDDLFRLEPLYLRGSSAEEKAKGQGNARTGVPFQ